MSNTLLNTIKVVLWDIDGTILNFHEAQKYAIRKLFSEYNLGECSDKMLSDYDSINKKYWQALERGELSKQEVLTGRFKEFFKKYELDTSIVTAFNDSYQLSLGDTICYYEGAREAIANFAEMGITQFAVTNGTKVAQDKKLSKTGLDKIFDGIFISEEVGFEKPNPGFFEPVLEKAREIHKDIQLDEIIIIGASLTSDIKLGNNVGIKTCWFRHDGEQDTDLRVDIEVRSIKELCRREI